MSSNPLHWRRTLAGLSKRYPEWGNGDPRGQPAGVPVLGEPCPAAVRIPLRAVIKQAFLAGNPEAPLVDALADVEGWNRDETAAAGSRRVQVIVPVRGAHEALRLCLSCLYAHTDQETFELSIPHAEAEADSVLKVWSGARVTIDSRTRTDVGNPTKASQSFAANVNLGASRSRSELLVLLNSDAYVGPGWLEALLAPFDDPDVVAVGPSGTYVSGHQAMPLDMVMGDTAAWVAHYVRWRSLERKTRGIPEDEPYPARRLVGFCIAIRRSAWDRVGGMDERFANAYCDDDLSLRLSLVGKCVVVPDLLVLHEGQASFRELPDAERAYDRALVQNGARFREKWGWILREWNAWMDAEGWR